MLLCLLCIQFWISASKLILFAKLVVLSPYTNAVVIPKPTLIPPLLLNSYPFRPAIRVKIYPWKLKTTL